MQPPPLPRSGSDLLLVEALAERRERTDGLVPVDRALGILSDEVKAGQLDAELFRLFVEGQVFTKAE